MHKDASLQGGAQLGFGGAGEFLGLVDQSVDDLAWRHTPITRHTIDKATLANYLLLSKRGLF